MQGAAAIVSGGQSAGHSHRSSPSASRGSPQEKDFNPRFPISHIYHSPLPPPPIPTPTAKSMQVRVVIGGAHVRPGDWIYADEDGVLISKDALAL